MMGESNRRTTRTGGERGGLEHSRPAPLAPAPSTSNHLRIASHRALVLAFAFFSKTLMISDLSFATIHRISTRSRSRYRSIVARNCNCRRSRDVDSARSRSRARCECSRARSMAIDCLLRKGVDFVCVLKRECFVTVESLQWRVRRARQQQQHTRRRARS